MTWKTSTPLYNRPQIFKVGSVHWPSKCEAWILPSILSFTNSAVTPEYTILNGGTTGNSTSMQKQRAA